MIDLNDAVEKIRSCVEDKFDANKEHEYENSPISAEMLKDFLWAANIMWDSLPKNFKHEKYEYFTKDFLRLVETFRLMMLHESAREREAPIVNKFLDKMETVLNDMEEYKGLTEFERLQVLRVFGFEIIEAAEKPFLDQKNISTFKEMLKAVLGKEEDNK